MRKNIYFDITKMEITTKGYANQITTFENPVELIIDKSDMTFKINNSFPVYFKNHEVKFITDDNDIIKYKNGLLTIISEKIIK